MLDNCSIRPATIADAAALAELWTDAGVARPWNDPERDISFALARPHSTILVAELEGVPVASAMIGEDGHRGWLYYVAVAQRHQGRGLGRAIMQAGEDWLRARGVWKIQVLIRTDNVAAQDFYARLGFHDTQSACFQKIISD